MGVMVKEKGANTNNWYIHINYHNIRIAKKVEDESTAVKIAEKIEHKLYNEIITYQKLPKTTHNSNCKNYRHKKRGVKIITYTDSEVNKLLFQIKKYSNGLYYPAILTLVETGVTISELRGIKWGDINFLNNTITIKRIVYNSTIKTRENSRVINLSSKNSQILKELKIKRQKEQLPNWTDFENYWVFTVNHFTPTSVTPIAKCLHSCAGAVGLQKIRVHDLRHTYVRIGLTNKQSVFELSKQLGYKNLKAFAQMYVNLIGKEGIF